MKKRGIKRLQELYEGACTDLDTLQCDIASNCEWRAHGGSFR
jgi:hypothetical protein